MAGSDFFGPYNQYVILPTKGLVETLRECQCSEVSNGNSKRYVCKCYVDLYGKRLVKYDT